MNEDRKNELEGMLKAVQDLKEQFYIGTKEAYRYLQAVKITYETPKEIADNINQLLGSLAYLATPERVVGLEQSVYEAMEKVEEEIHEYGKIIDPYKFPSVILSERHPVLRIFEGGFMMLEGFSEEKTRAMSLIFKYANEKGVKDNNEFGQAVVEAIIKSYETVKEDTTKCESYMDCGVFIENLSTELLNINWQEYLSRKRLRELEREMTEASLRFLSTEDMVERLERDHVEDRIEYRRAILCKWLQEEENEEISRKGYLSLVEKADRNISGSRRRMKEIPARCKGDEEFFHHMMTKREEKILRRTLFIRKALGREKNFVERYIAHF